MERIDKVIANTTKYSRNDVKKLIKERKISVNNEIVLKNDIKIDQNKDILTIDNENIIIKDYVYLILNKPKGYVSATFDKKDKTVLDLVPSKYRYRKLFPAGRLDKDTTGLMIITDDGIFAHDILAPLKHVKKTYEVVIDIPITKNMVDGFRNGIVLSNEMTHPAILEIKDKYTGIVTLTEGRYHQIKRMFSSFSANVTLLKRIKIGNLLLPEDLDIGECRELTENELKLIKER